jgi:hypothetical protein
MRSLLPAPDAALDPQSAAPRYGSYRGGLPRVDLSPLLKSRTTRVLRHKRWMYVAMATGDLYVAVCVVRLGYAANAWAFAYDARTARLVVDRSILAAPFACRVGDSSSDGCEASIRSGRERIEVRRARGATAYDVEADVRGLTLRARIESKDAPPPITAIARLDGGRGLLNTTEKRALLAATGDAVIDGERRSLDGALAGYDYTNGLLARRTSWRWAFFLGNAASGERVAMNLVQGFVGEAECAAWVDGEVFPLSEGRFSFDAADPLRTWQVTSKGGEVDLRFTPGGAHAEKRNLGLVSSRFIHPIGAFEGTLRAGGRELAVQRALGVTEDQDVTW